MKKEQATQLLEQVERYKQLNISSKVADKYAETDIDSEQIAEQMSISDFIYLCDKIIENFDSRILLKDWESYISYPFVFINRDIDNNPKNVSHSLTLLNNNIEKSLFDLNTFNYMYDLLLYQQTNNIEKVELEYDLLSKQDKIQKLESRYTTSLSIVSELEKRTKSINKEVTEFYDLKKQNLQEIENHLQSTRTKNQEILNFHTHSTANDAAINQLKDNQKANLDISSKLLEVEKQKFEDVKKNIQEAKESIDNQLAEISKKDKQYEDKLKIVTDKVEYFEGRNKYLDELIGREVGASLFETFKQRKSELKFSVRVWIVAVTVVGIACGFWVFHLATSSTLSPSGTTWEVLVTTGIKSIPAFLLFWFFVGQYKKERNFQEEYAFKSAVALTIDAYSQKIKDDGKRDEMIIEAVKSVYSSPTDISVKIDSKDVSPKDLMDLVKDFGNKLAEKK